MHFCCITVLIQLSCIMKENVFGIPNADIKVKNKHFAVISKYRPGILTASQLPLKTTIRDKASGNRYECELIEVLPFQNEIPTVLCLWAENDYPENCISSIHARHQTSFFNELALYVYATL